jgi:hypothetical protein
MKPSKGFVSLGAMLVSAMVGLGGIGSVMFMANVHQLLPNNTWTDVFHDKADVLAYAAELTPTPTSTPVIEEESMVTPTPTPSVIVTPTPIPSLSVTPTPTRVPAQEVEDDEEQEDHESTKEDDNKKEDHKNKEKEFYRMKAQTALKSAGDGWLKYKLMFFGKVN